MHLLNKLAVVTAAAIFVLVAASAAQATMIFDLHSGPSTGSNFSFKVDAYGGVGIHVLGLSSTNHQQSYSMLSGPSPFFYGHKILDFSSDHRGHDFHISKLWLKKFLHKKWKCEVPIPEPSSALVFGVGLLIVRGASRRRRR